MRHDYASMGFYTFDCLGWPFTRVPEGGGTVLLDEITMAVSGAAGTAAIVGAKLGLRTLAVGGYGQDMMGDWAVGRLEAFGVDTSAIQRLEGVPSSSSIVLTRPDGSRPALHLKGATGHFVVDESQFDAVTDARVFHMGGIGLMDAMDGPRNAALMRHAKERGCVTTVDVFAGSLGTCRTSRPCCPGPTTSSPRSRRRRR
jgi:sugar/nucleoside kinase (ribokinase family)